MDQNQLQEVIVQAVQSVPVADAHTHLFNPAFSRLLLRGIDDLLTYHYLVAETLRYHPEKMAEFWGLPVQKQADLVWQTLFIERSPVSEACRGVLTVLRAYGLDLGCRDLTAYRRFFAELDPEEQVEIVFKEANLKYVVMTNDPFDPVEKAYWEQGVNTDPRFKAALRLDQLLNRWPETAGLLQAEGYEAQAELSGRTFAEVRRFLTDWAKRMNPLYLAVSLPPDFTYPDLTPRGRLLKEVILPFCQEHGKPLALMIGVKKLVNPSLRLAGDSVGKALINTVENLCVENPEVKFFLTMLARENQHELAVAARKFGNLMPFGCWWFLNNPSLIREITRMRLELLGLSFVPQHSDARVLDQLIYKWSHSKQLIAEVLTEAYTALAETGWELNAAEIKQDVERLFFRNFEKFMGME
ncbi:MAG TPA: glucuronate isomerase [Bacillota bacterium]